MKKIAVTAVLLILHINIWAAPGWVKGTVIDAKSREVLEYVNISVRLQETDSLIKGTMSDEDGNFVLDGLQDGNYILTVSYIGYKGIQRNFTISSTSSSVDLELLYLEEDTQVLNEVQVVGQRSQMRFELDRRVFNVDRNIASTGGSASDVLANIPSVEVDNEGQVSLRGNSSVTVWINGRASGLISENRGSILTQLPADNIERVEIITNPSARYSPEGTAGIINIILKRDRRAGYFGGVQAGMDTHKGYNFSANMNYSSSVVEAYASLGYRRGIYKNGGNMERYNLSDEGLETSVLNQTANGQMDGRLTVARAGTTWHITRKDHLSFSGMGMSGGHDRDNRIDYLLSDGNHSAIYNRQRIQSENGDFLTFNLDLNYKHEFSENSNLDFTISHNQWQLDADNRYDDLTQYVENNREESLYQRQDNRTRNKAWDIQLDYINKWNDNNRIEAGYKGTLERNNNPVSTYSGTNISDIVFDPNLYNRFLYDQDIHALYITYGGQWNKLSYQAGLRGEYALITTQPNSWNTENDAEITGEKHKKDYSDLFPSVFISYALSAGNEIQLNYTRRISRPRGGQLNSFRNITDATNISFGNPDLNPQYSNAFELNHIKNWDEHTLSFSGYYRTTDDVIQRISYMNDENVMYSTSENVSQSQSAGLELVAKNRLFLRLDLTSTINAFYYKLDGFNFTPEGSQTVVTGNSVENFSWNARVIANISLPFSSFLQLIGNYNARQVIAQGYRQPGYMLDAGLRKSFMDGKLSISLNARDILASAKWKTVTSGTGFHQVSENWFGGRFFGLTLIYNFGNMQRNNNMEQNDNEGGALNRIFGN